MSGVTGYDPEQMRDELRAAAEAVQRANRLTVEGYTSAEQHYDAVGALVALVDRVPQFVEHVRRCLRRAGAETHFSDDGRPLGEVLVETDADLTDAVEHLEIAARALSAAWSGIGHLAYDPFPEGEPREQDTDQAASETAGGESGGGA